ncbi:MAG: hypothetical protein HYY23_00655 [Verrucomicrobia bacterium]|nr:hypothetical protein [Verrucomicrobiota bacterium]
MVAELYCLHSHGDPEERRLASLSLAQIASWDIQVFPLTNIQRAVARRFASAIIVCGLLPASEINDAFILAETAAAEIPLVVSSDNHLLEIDHDILREVCVEADFAPVFPVNPRRLLRAIR